MTLAQIVTAVRSNTSRSDKDDTAKTAVTLGLKRLASRYSFRMTEQTTDLDVAPGSYYVTLPVGVVRVIAAYWINGTQSERLIVKSREWVNRRIPDAQSYSTSYPKWAYLEGNRLNFVPGSTDTGIIRITYQPSLSMVDDADENPVPSLDEAIIAFATGWVFASIEKFEAAQWWYSQANQAFNDVMMTDTEQPAIQHSFDQKSPEETSFIEPYLDPFAGHFTGWYG